MKMGKKIHTLKLDEKYYNLLVSKKKRFEYRFNDRDYQVGDYLDLECSNGRGMRCVVRYILSDFPALNGYVIMDVEFMFEYLVSKNTNH
jgi:hypothetical protein